jgi:hypothetical protein
LSKDDLFFFADYFSVKKNSNLVIMSKKGKEKNTKNKAKHSKLMARKENKKRAEKKAHETRVKALLKKHHAQQKMREEENDRIKN